MNMKKLFLLSLILTAPVAFGAKYSSTPISGKDFVGYCLYGTALGASTGYFSPEVGAGKGALVGMAQMAFRYLVPEILRRAKAFDKASNPQKKELDLQICTALLGYGTNAYAFDTKRFFWSFGLTDALLHMPIVLSHDNIILQLLALPFKLADKYLNGVAKSVEYLDKWLFSNDTEQKSQPQNGNEQCCA
jgi:hypothetical protein